MKEWFSASELAGLPGGLPGTARRVRSRADQDGWKSHKKQKGKGYEYHISALPAETQHHLRNERVNAIMADRYPAELVIVPGEKTREELAEEQAEKLHIRARGTAEFARIPKHDRKKQRARARLWILESMWNYRCEHQLYKRTSRIEFCLAFAEGKINAPASVARMLPKYRGKQGVHPDVLAKWETDYMDRGIMTLTDNYGGNKGKNKITKTPSLFKIVIGAMVNQPHIKAKSIKEFLKAAHTELNIVSTRTIQRFMGQWIEENTQIWTFITNPDAWKNVYMAAAGSHFERITALNMLWELDSTPADWMLTDGRHSVVGCIDLYSRRLKYHVSKTSKAMAVCQVFRRSVLDWGVPQGARTDNGQDYISMQFETVMRDLEIMHEICIPFASEEKGTIERSMRTLSHGILDLLPGFIGHNVAERKQIEARKSFSKRMMTKGAVIEVEMSAADLQKHLDNWCEHVYGKDVHSGIGMSPWNKASAWTGPVHRIEDERALDMLLAEVGGIRRVTKKGIRFDNHTYIFDAMGEYVGRDVLLRYDEQDMGRIYVYFNQEFVDVAQCPDITGISRREAATAIKRRQKKKMAEQKRELQAFARHDKRNIAEVVMEHRIAESENVVAMPHTSEAHTTPALKAAARAAGALDTPTTTPLTDAEQTEYERLQQADAAEDSTPESLRHLGDDPVRDYRLWESLSARANRGENLLPAEADFVRGYATSIEHDAMEKFVAAE